jgi:hypothetical protein
MRHCVTEQRNVQHTGDSSTHLGVSYPRLYLLHNHKLLWFMMSHVTTTLFLPSTIPQSCPHPPPHTLISAGTYPMPGQEENEHRDTNPSQICPQAFYFSPQPLFTTDHSIHNPGCPLKSSKPNAHDNTAAMGPMTTGKPKQRHKDTTGLTMARRVKRLHSQTTTLQVHRHCE